MPSLRDALVAQAASQMKAIREFAPFLERTLAAKAFVSHRSSVGGRRMSNLCPLLVMRAKIIFRSFSRYALP